MSKKPTIKDLVLENADHLKSLETHDQLRKWAVENKLDNQSAFPKFKTALLDIGISYDGLKGSAHKEAEEDLEKKISHQVTLYSDAKASAGRFGICDGTGEVVWYGRFFESDHAGEQSQAELAAADKAVWFASKIKEALGAEAIALTLFVDAQWLCYQQHSKQKGYVLTQKARKFGIKLTVEWISGKENPADRWTVADGFKKWSENDLSALATTI